MSRSERRKRLRQQSSPQRATVGSQRFRTAALLLIEQALYVGLFLSVALAFDRELHIQFALPKLAWLRMGVPCLAVLWLIRVYRGQIKPLPPLVFASAVAVAFWWVVSTLFAQHLPTALFGYYGRYNGLWTYLTCLALFLFAASSARSAEAIERLVKLFAVALVPVAALGVYQYFYPDPAFPEHRSPSTIGHPVSLAATLGLALPFVLTFLLAAPAKLGRVLWGAVFGVMLAAVVATLSRGPWVGVTVAFAILLVGRPRWMRPAPVVTAVLILLVMAIASLYVVGRFRSGTYTSLMGRLTYSSTALRMLWDYPITGVGFENFALLYPRYRPTTGFGSEPNLLPTMVHNGYLQTAVTNGVPALLLYGLLLFAVLRTLYTAYRGAAEWRRQRLTIAFAASIAGYLVQDVSGWPEVPLLSFFWLLLGLAVCWGTPAPDPSRGLPGWLRGVSYSFGLAVICASLALLAHTVREIRADALLTRAEAADPRQSWAVIQPDIRAALNANRDDAAYLDRAARIYARRMFAVPDPDAYEQARSLFERAHALNPFDSYVLLHRIDLETAALRQKIISTASPQAEKAVSAALEMDGNNPSVYEACARFRGAQNQLAEALRLVEKAITLWQNDAQYYMLKGDILRSMGDPEKATAAYRKGTSRLRAGTPEWASAKYQLITNLAALGKHQAALDESKDVIARAPNSSASRMLQDMIARNMLAPAQ